MNKKNAAATKKHYETKVYPAKITKIIQLNKEWMFAYIVDKVDVSRMGVFTAAIEGKTYTQTREIFAEMFPEALDLDNPAPRKKTKSLYEMLTA